MAVTRTTSDAGLVQPVAIDGFTRLFTSPSFLVHRFSLGAASNQPLGEADKLQILIALGEGGELIADTNAQATPMRLPRGQAVVLPIAGQPFSLRGTQAVDVVRVSQP